MLVFLMHAAIILFAQQHPVQTGANIPSWAANTVWYQIFPERFHNGDPGNDPVVERIGNPHGWDLGGPHGWKITPWTSDWYQRADWEQRIGPDFYQLVFSRRYGGDLQGVIDKLDYLAGLGITGIYFNPIFDAVSLHKYDASHFHHIDRHFGPDPEGDLRIMEQEDPADPSTWQWTSADRLFLELLVQARQRGIRVIIDGVWNHTGRDFWAFRHIRQHGQQSPFREWYKISHFDPALEDGFEYEGWWGYKGLPEFTEVGQDLHPAVKEHIFAVTRRWMAPDGDPSRGVDGWRLDVAEEVGMDFWRDWHRLVREINPEALTVAEIWTDAAREYIGDDYFSIVMNYRWAYATHAFFINQTLNAREFTQRLDSLQQDFPLRVNLALQNLMDSHDTERLPSMIVNHENAYKEESKIREIDNQYDVRAPRAEEWQLQRLIALFQYSWVGAPMIYYGTEAGMWGADDPDDRKPMVWPDLEYDTEINHPYSRQRPADRVAFDHDLFNWYSLLGRIRAESPALQQGDFTFLDVPGQDQVIAFVRQQGNDIAFVLINRSSSSFTMEVSTAGFRRVPRRLTDQISGITVNVSRGIFRAEIPPVSGMIFRP